MKQFVAGIVVGVFLTIGGTYGYYEYLYITPIGDIKGDKDSFDGKTVRIRGTAGKSATLPGTSSGGYLVADDTGKIIVLTKSGAPDENEQVKVTGVVDLIVGIPVIRPPSAQSDEDGETASN